MDAPFLSEDDLNEIYSWVDQIPLSRPKKNIARDFSDGVLLAEIISQFEPRIVELHNYSSANSAKQKYYNWETLNKKVFKKLGFSINGSDIKNVVECKPEVIERVLKVVKVHLEASLNQSRFSPQRTNTEGFNHQQKNVSNNQQQFQQSSKQDEIIWEKEQVIGELKETIEIMELKIKKLEDLLTLKDNKIKAMQDKMSQHGLY